MDKIRQEIESLKKDLIIWRRHFHSFPELSFQESNTANTIFDFLCRLSLKAGLSSETPKIIAKTGVVFTLKGKEAGETILLRADMDALPIREENDVPYRSKKEGVMHACGHDGHMAMLLIAAKILSRHRDELKGSVKFVFQPSEEKSPGGAKIMIEEGVLEDPKPDMAFALHLDTDIDIGAIGLTKGPLMAFCDGFEMTVFGKSGHAAYSHQAVDAISVARYILSAWDNILTREISPTEQVVMQTCEIHGGTASNVIADKTEIRGTVRFFNAQLREFIIERMETTAIGIAKSMRAKASFNYTRGYPALINDGPAIDFVSHVIEHIKDLKTVGVEQVMGGEDFAYFLERIPGCFAWLGARNDQKGLNQSHHNSRFDFDEDALALGVEVMVKTALEYLK